MGELISIIVPVYNVDKYLEKCVDSIINQTYKNIEIILVNDGSTDGSGQVCDYLAKKDSRIAVYHKENGGVSSARNLGLDNAQGDYIGFIDSDDYIDPDMYESLYDDLKKYNVDISMCGLYHVYANKKDEQVDKVQNYIINSNDAINLVLDGKFSAVTPGNKLYKKSLFLGIRYDLNISIAEDALMIIKLLEQCRLISINTEKKYYYYHRENSLTTSSFSQKTLDIITVYQRILKIIEENNPSIIDSAKRRVFWAYFYVLDALCISELRRDYDKLFDKLLSELKSNAIFILISPKFTFKRKILFLSLLISERLYKNIILKFKNRVN